MFNLKKSSLIKILLLIVASLLALGLWSWLLTNSVPWLYHLHGLLNDILGELQENKQYSGWLLILVSFIYGVVHSIGPGHGKLVLTSYAVVYQKQPAQLLILSFSAAMLQALTAILIIGVGYFAFSIIGRKLTSYANYSEQLSWGMLALLGLYWLYLGVKKILQLFKEQQHHEHQHSEDCGCGKLSQLTVQDTWQERALTLLAIALRPCSGNLLVLIFALSNGIWWWGVAASLVMGLGTGVTLMLLMIFVNSYKNFLLQQTANPKLAKLLKLSLGLIAIGLGLLVIYSAFQGFTLITKPQGIF